jgi:RES domain-containing protein
LKAFRLCRRPYTALDGEGARLYGGRWNPKGVPLVYASSTLALAAMEALVHFTSNILPADYVSLAIDIPKAVRVTRWTLDDLPSEWASNPPSARDQALGAAWIASGKSAVLVVPSAVLPDESNVLINPRHPDAASIRAQRPARFTFDPRLRANP